MRGKNRHAHVHSVRELSLTTPPANEGRGSWIPTGAMVATRFMELRKRRALMITTGMLTIGIPAIFLTIRLLRHAFAPHTNEPAGDYHTFNGLTVGVLFVFTFVMAAALGCTAGSADLDEGMLAQLVVTGRSRAALYLARIPAGLAIIVPMVAIAYTIICAVCVFSAPTTYSFQGATVPLGLSQAGYENWATAHTDDLICDFPFDGPCPGPTQPSTPLTKAQATATARQDYPNYAQTFLAPSTALMVRTGLWIVLQGAVGFIVGLGFSSLTGSRTLPLVLMLLSYLVLSPFFLIPIPHLVNLQRLVVILAMYRLEPSALGFVVPGIVGAGPAHLDNPSRLPPEMRIVAVLVVAGWLAGWTVLGAWRMMTRDV